MDVNEKRRRLWRQSALPEIRRRPSEGGVRGPVTVHLDDRGYGSRTAAPRAAPRRPEIR